MSHLRAFVANQVLWRIRAFLGLFCPDFYSDIRDFTQILCRYLPKKLAAGTSASDNNNYEQSIKAEAQPITAEAQSGQPEDFAEAHQAELYQDSYGDDQSGVFKILGCLNSVGKYAFLLEIKECCGE